MVVVICMVGHSRRLVAAGTGAQRHGSKIPTGRGRLGYVRGKTETADRSDNSDWPGRPSRDTLLRRLEVRIHSGRMDRRGPLRGQGQTISKAFDSALPECKLSGKQKREH